jgi:hypothetical protein
MVMQLRNHVDKFGEAYRKRYQPDAVARRFSKTSVLSWNEGIVALSLTSTISGFLIPLYPARSVWIQRCCATGISNDHAIAAKKKTAALFT